MPSSQRETCHLAHAQVKLSMPHQLQHWLSKEATWQGKWQALQHKVMIGYSLLHDGECRLEYSLSMHNAVSEHPTVKCCGNQQGADARPD